MMNSLKMINEDIKQFYEKLYDEESKVLYCARLQYSFDKDYYKLMEDTWGINKDKEWDIAPITKKLLGLCVGENRVFIFGAGNNGKNIYWELYRFSCVDVYCFLDNDISLQGQKWCGVSIYHPKEVGTCINDYKIILSIEEASARQEVKEQLESYGVDIDNVIDPFLDGEKGVYSHVGNQYFDFAEIIFDENEVFVDVGCCDGATIEMFIKKTDNKYSHIYGFEPDVTCVQKCRNRFCNDKRINILQKGAWSKNGQVYFEEKNEGMSCITDNGTKIIDVDSIDRVCMNDKVTCIKMDIEGAELEALKGAEVIIKRDKPKLAICIYHKPEDMWEIPQLLMDYNPDYQYAIRHYHLTDYETVLYAW